MGGERGDRVPGANFYGCPGDRAWSCTHFEYIVPMITADSMGHPGDRAWRGGCRVATWERSLECSVRPLMTPRHRVPATGCPPDDELRRDLACDRCALIARSRVLVIGGGAAETWRADPSALMHVACVSDALGLSTFRVN